MIENVTNGLPRSFSKKCQTNVKNRFIGSHPIVKSLNIIYREEMSYNPYANIADEDATQTNRLHQPQPHRASYVSPQQQSQQTFQQQQPQQPSSFSSQQQFQQAQQSNQFFSPAANPQDAAAYGNFLNDPRAAMTFQVGQNAMLAGSHFVEQNFGKYVHTDDIKYYFKISNSYVLNKLILILFPFKNKNWLRSYRASDPNAPQDPNIELYAYPLDDKNAVDLYIPLMGAVTYILSLALLAGLRGEFHPEVFGFKTSSTLAYLLLDFAVLKLGLYLLNISSKMWDLICYIGYKFVPLVLVIFVKNISNFKIFNWVIYLYLLLAYGFFELRAIRFNLYGGIHNSAQTMNNKSFKNSNYFLFIYAFAFQGALLWLMS